MSHVKIRLKAVCESLVSNKISERKKYCDVLLGLLHESETIEHLQTDDESAKLLLEASYTFLVKEKEKLLGASIKKRLPTNLKVDIYFQVLEIIIREVSEYDVDDIMKNILFELDCEHTSKDCLNVLQKVMLPNSFIQSRLSDNDWEELFDKFKVNMNQNLFSDNKHLRISNLVLVLKHGPLHTFPVGKLREQFDYMTKMCLLITIEDVRVLQEGILDIIYYFCLYTAKDNRMACCKLGEDVLLHLLSLYELKFEGIKIKLVQFFCLQLVLHNPNGNIDPHPTTYAFSRDKWNSCIKAMNEILDQDCLNVIKPTNNYVSVVMNKNNIQFFHDDVVNLHAELLRHIHLQESHFYNDEVESHAEKRQKIESPIKKLIYSIQEKQNWPWIHVMCVLLKSYPEILNTDDFLNLLNVLSKLQLDSKNANVTHHIYSCLCILQDIQVNLQFLNKSELEGLWKLVGETTLKSFGLGQNIVEMNNLLQKFVKNTSLLDAESVLETFKSGVLNTTADSIKTLNTVVKYLDSPPNIQISEILIKWILNTSKVNKNTYDYLSEVVTAKVLTGFAIKQWTSVSDLEMIETTPKEKLYHDVSDLYLKTSFQDGLMLFNLQEKQIQKVLEKSHSISTTLELKTILKNMLTNFVDQFLRKEIHLNVLLNVLHFLKNVISYMFNYEILEEEHLEEFPVWNKIDTIWKLVQKKFGSLSDINLNKNSIVKLNKMFCVIINEQVEEAFLKKIPIDFLKLFVDFIGKTGSNYKPPEDFYVVKILCVRMLTNYCCRLKNRFETQQFALEELAEAEYISDYNQEYELGLTFVETLLLCRPSGMNEKVLTSVLILLNKICQSRYRYYTTALRVVKIFYDLYPYVAKSDTDENKILCANLLFPFYQFHQNYGPELAVAVINCIGKFYEVDPECTFAIWNDEEIVLKLPEFLCSNFQEVRFAAIKNIVKFYKLSDARKSIEGYRRQKLIFEKVKVMCEKVFEVKGTFTDERKIDETVTRSSSVMHLLSAILVTSTTWREDALFTLVTIVVNRKLENFPIVLKMVSDELRLESEAVFLEKYIHILVQKWIQNGYFIEDFPLTLFGCETKTDLYKKYLPVLVTFVIKFEKESLQEIVDGSAKTLDDILQEYFPKLFSTCLVEEIPNLTVDTLEKNELYRFLFEKLGITECNNLILSKIDALILNLIQNLRDEQHFNETFNEDVRLEKFGEHFLKLGDFMRCLHFIQDTVCNEESLMTFLLKNFSNKIQKIMMDLHMQMYDCIDAEDRLIVFHHYTIVAAMVSQNLKISKAQFFFVREIIYTMLHLIKDFTRDLALSKIAACYLKLFFCNVLPHQAHKVSVHFTSVVTILKEIALENYDLTPYCTDLLTLLIVDNKVNFTEAISELDPFPDIRCMDSLNKIHAEVKYNKSDLQLNDEIHLFLNFGKLTKNFFSREEGLKRLRNQLHLRKEHLKLMYEKLGELKGSSEDCENSLLHQLISMLVKLSGSPYENVNMEALRCLGELGAGNLTTLVVQSEEHHNYVSWSPLELLVGIIISLLSDYIIDENIKMIQPTSEALYEFMNTKEGRRTSGSTDNFGYGCINWTFLDPFVTNPKPKAMSLDINKNQFMLTLIDDNLWVPKHHAQHVEWIKNLVCSILNTFSKNCSLVRLVPICQIKVEFCEKILPPLIYLILSMNKKELTSIMTSKIDYFIDEHWRMTIGKHGFQQHSIVLNKSSVQCILDVVHFVRVNKNNTKSKSKMLDLDLDYLKVAQAAQYCTAHFTSLIYVELWCQTKVQDKHLHDSKSFSGTLLDAIYETENTETAVAVQNIFRTAYKSIGDTDALQGCSTSILLDPQSRVEYYKDNQTWDHVVHFYDAQNSSDSLIESLMNSGLYTTAVMCSQSSESPPYESLWRLGQWDFNKPKKSGNHIYLNNDDLIQKYKYFALKSLHDSDLNEVEENIKHARHCIVQTLKHTSLESSKNLYLILTYLQQLNELEDFAKVDTQPELEELLKKWKMQDEINQNSFCYIEPIRAQRIVLLKDCYTRRKLQFFKQSLLDMALNLSELARVENKFYIGNAAVAQLYKLKLSGEEICNVQFQDAQLCWESNNFSAARCIINQLCSSENVEDRLKAKAFHVMGKCLVKSYSENRHVIIKDYFLKSLDIYKHIIEKTPNDLETILETYDCLAKFADREYQQVTALMASDAFQKKVQNLEKSKQHVDKILQRGPLSLDEKKAICVNKKQCTIDETEIAETKKEKDNFLAIALRYYIFYLLHSDKNNLQIFRFMALFFENRSNAAIKVHIDRYITTIPSYKFLTILPQIIPHINDENTEDFFSFHSNKIVERCAKDHPHHTLPLLLALVNSNKDLQYSAPKTKAPQNDRVTNALNLLTKLKRDPSLTQLIKEQEYLADALIELAYFKPDLTPQQERKMRRIDIPSENKIRSIKNYESIAVPTDNLAVQKNAVYGNIIGIRSFEENYANVGGVNVPKRIVCIGMDGRERNQLVKGKDDLRQDAVMQQVFTIINNLLGGNTKTKNLSIRTYKVVPLSMRSGVLEWADNTTPLGAFLVGDSESSQGAHQTFRPQDKSPAYCRETIRKAANFTPQDKLNTYKKICKRIKPVFHKFFETSYLHPTIWYEKRRAYIHSVATTSMAGYILGIGDRHVSNILLDKSTAEVVHIDFGIAFEQGKTLPTPETVPFRLTRDVVDGMGVSGVEGAFRRSCEKTMTVLRENSQTIVTILEVLLYDPLYSWTVSSAEANKRQHDDSDENVLAIKTSDEENICININITAERALLRLKAKLQGIEDGNPSSVEHQVGSLIQQALDPANLCRLFNGWQAYL